MDLDLLRYAVNRPAFDEAQQLPFLDSGDAQ